MKVGDNVMILAGANAGKRGQVAQARDHAFGTGVHKIEGRDPGRVNWYAKGELRSIDTDASRLEGVMAYTLRDADLSGGNQ
ncbi:KOW motif-containing protein [Sphingomonas sp.]|uniref:KOW motif-containing protein n=1 Tax=Sphingomonas sp. TaxID=28214 RepID=UPI0031D0C22F